MCETMCSDTRKKKIRTIFTAQQVKKLNDEFEKNSYLTSYDRVRVARDLELTESQVKVWFQNKRNKYKRNHEFANSVQSAMNKTFAYISSFLPQQQHHHHNQRQQVNNNPLATLQQQQANNSGLIPPGQLLGGSGQVPGLPVTSLASGPGLMSLSMPAPAQTQVPNLVANSDSHLNQPVIPNQQFQVPNSQLTLEQAQLMLHYMAAQNQAAGQLFSWSS